MIADDDAVIRHVTETVLRRQGYQVITAADGDTALRLFQEAKETIRLVVSDQSMPGLRGPDLIAAVRKLSPTVAALLMSGTSPIAPSEDLPVLLKPFSVERFVAKVQELLGTGDGKETKSAQPAESSRDSNVSGRKEAGHDCTQSGHS
jgi:two-component system cell cycle sensor histidine kinase/response regulator CckA